MPGPVQLAVTVDAVGATVLEAAAAAPAQPTADVERLQLFVPAPAQLAGQMTLRPTTTEPADCELVFDRWI